MRTKIATPSNLNKPEKSLSQNAKDCNILTSRDLRIQSDFKHEMQTLVNAIWYARISLSDKGKIKLMSL
jgi:hypothetical protein